MRNRAGVMARQDSEAEAMSSNADTESSSFDIAKKIDFVSVKQTCHSVEQS